jgi:hypothetical protein
LRRAKLNVLRLEGDVRGDRHARPSAERLIAHLANRRREPQIAGGSDVEDAVVSGEVDDVGRSISSGWL